jgi:hypothetical protein
VSAVFERPRVASRRNADGTLTLSPRATPAGCEDRGRLIQIKARQARPVSFAASSTEQPTGPRVTSLHGKLFAWHRLQLDCEAARLRLKEAMAGRADDATLLALNGEIERLRAEMDATLLEVEALRSERAKAANPDF